MEMSRRIMGALQSKSRAGSPTQASLLAVFASEWTFHPPEFSLFGKEFYMLLENKIVIITGASSGIGRETARLFAEEGATVVAAARRKERLEELAKETAAYKGKVIPYQLDVTVKEEIEAMIDQVLLEFGRLDVLYNNAGIMDEMMPIGELSDDIFRQVMEVNVYGPMCAMRKAVNVMLNQGGGIIINTASVAGLQGTRAGAAYTASKHAVVGMTKNTAFMYGDKNIRCNAICPGGVETEVGVHIKNPSPLGIAKATSGASAAKTGQPIDIARVALFLASDLSGFVNGMAIAADGGWIAY